MKNLFALECAARDIRACANNLRDANINCSSVEHIVVMDLIHAASHLLNKIGELVNALRSDEREKWTEHNPALTSLDKFRCIGLDPAQTVTDSQAGFRPVNAAEMGGKKE